MSSFTLKLWLQQLIFTTAACVNNYPSICCGLICFMVEEKREEQVACLPTAHQLRGRVQMSRLSIKAGFLIRAALSPGYSSGVTSDKSALTDHCNFPSQQRPYTNTHLMCLFLCSFHSFVFLIRPFPYISS